MTARRRRATIPRMALLERAHALDSLAEYAQSAASGEGRTVLVAGEAGVGKTALVDAFCAQATQLSWLRGACDGLFTPRPLGPIIDIAVRAGGDLLAAIRPDAPREEVFAAVLRLLKQRPTGLVIEDVHWADEATLDLIAFLGRRVRDAAAMLIVTYRDDALPVSHPLQIVLGELAAARSTRRVGVAPLSEQAVVRLSLDAGMDPDAVYRLTGGNAFFVTELVVSGTTAVPASARALAQARLARVSSEARRLVEACALLGTAVEPEIACAVAECGAAELDELVGAGVLASGGVGLQFRHEITRLAVEEGVAAHRRQAIHQRVLAALLARGCSDNARLAHHAEHAGDRVVVLDVAPRAAREAAALASHREAAAQYERALRFADGADAAARAAWYAELAAEDSLIDRFEGAADAGRAALELYQQAGDAIGAGDMQRRLAHTMWRLCRGADALAYAHSAVATLEPCGPSEPLAAAYAMQAYLSEDVAAARRGQEVAEQVAAPALLSDALDTEAWLHAHRGGSWSELMDRALRVALEAGAAAQAGRAYANTHTILITQRRLADAEPYFHEGFRYCEDHDLSTWLTCLRGWRSVALQLSGRWDEAAALCNATLQSTASPVNRLTSLVTLGLIRARRDDASSWACLDEAAETARGTVEPTWSAMVGLARAEARWLAGDDEAARHELATVSVAAGSGDAYTRGAYAIWVRRTGSSADPPTGGIADVCALTLARAPLAAAAWDRLGCGYEGALALLEVADEASTRAALERFDKLGATAAARRARQHLRTLGARSIPSGVRATTRTHPRGLTSRERQVLDLLCAGRTNAQICAELVISERTVDHHVSAVLRKLGVSNRAMAAAEANRLGLVAPEM